MKGKRITRTIAIYVLIFLILFGLVMFMRPDNDKETKEIHLTKMIEYMEQGKVEEVEVVETAITATLKDGNKVIAYVSTTLELPYITEKYLLSDEYDIDYYSKKPKSENIFLSLLPTLVMMAALVFLFMFFINQGGGGGKAMQFGKSRAKMQKAGEGPKVTYNDVAGLDEEKEELAEVVDFLRDPRKYNKLGARIPKGILLVGPPGTGKTYLSKATAGEAGVPFFTISGSDFVEMFVGVGASRVRDLFEQAKKNSPCIIFIDEIDAVGRKRGAGLGGGHDEREQTLNQLLVEMDGFAENSGIIILAATNRPDILDPALLRPGRFDRQVVIGIPDIKGREEIFKVHSRNKPLSDEVSPEVLARRTPGFTPADIENMLNEAALITARRNGLKIRMEEIEEAITKVIAGPEKKSRVINEKERRITAFHEAGHAVVERSIPDNDPVHQITIIPRGRAGGFTMSLPTEDRAYGTKKTMLNDIVGLLGGRVAEMLVMGDISTGASNDIQRATQIARDMVTKYGFSDRIGLVSYNDSEEVFLGKDFTSHKSYSEEVASEIDMEIKSIIDSCLQTCTRLLEENLDKLHAVAEALLLVETLDGDDFERLYTGEIDPETLKKEIDEESKTKAEKDAKEAKEAEKQRLKEEAEERARREAAQREALEKGYALDPENPQTIRLDGHSGRQDPHDRDREVYDRDMYRTDRSKEGQMQRRRRPRRIDEESAPGKEAADDRANANLGENAEPGTEAKPEVNAKPGANAEPGANADHKVTVKIVASPEKTKEEPIEEELPEGFSTYEEITEAAEVEAVEKAAEVEESKAETAEAAADEAETDDSEK